MVSAHDKRRAAVRAELIEGITRCGGVVNNEPCTRIHGEILKSEVSNRFYAIYFKKAVVVEGEVVPLCSLCALKDDAVAIDEAVRLAEQQHATVVPTVAAQLVPPAATPKVAPAPLVPAIGHVAAVRKDAPAAQPLAAQSAPAAPRKDERKHGPHPRSRNVHYDLLTKRAAFEDIFVLKPGGLCSCGDCDTRAGQAFATKNGDYRGQRFPLCPVGADAAKHAATRIRRDGGKPSYLTYQDVGDWKEFDRKQSAKTAQDAMRGQAILDGDFTASDDNRCVVTICRAPKPTDRVARIVDGKVVEYKICGGCAAAARKLRYQLKNDGQRWDFQLLDGETLSQRQEEDLRKASKLLQKQKSQKRPSPVVAKPSGQKAKGSDRPSSGRPSSREQFARVAAEIAAQKAAASATPKPVAVVAAVPDSSKPATEPTFASAPAAAPEAHASSPGESTMGGGN